MSAWREILPMASTLVAVPSAVVAWASFRRSAKAADAKDSAHASAVGLEYLRESLNRQEATILRQEGQIGELRGHLATCHRERERQDARIAELEAKLA